MLTHKKLSTQCTDHVSLKFTGHQSAWLPNGCVVRVSNMQLGVPAGGFVDAKRTAENQSCNHRNPARAFNTTPASTDPQNARPPTCTHASNNETATQPPCREAPNQHPTNGSEKPHEQNRSTTRTQATNPTNALNKIAQTHPNAVPN